MVRVSKDSNPERETERFSHFPVSYTGASIRLMRWSRSFQPRRFLSAERSYLSRLAHRGSWIFVMACWRFRDMYRGIYTCSLPLAEAQRNDCGAFSWRYWIPHFGYRNHPEGWQACSSRRMVMAYGWSQSVSHQSTPGQG